jgi:anti-sigma regulatory factor (Ser/Thr protein kinase)
VQVSRSSRLEHQLPARPESIAALRRAVVDFAAGGGASQRLREDIALAVSEAVSNVVLHAYAHSTTPGDVRVAAWIDAASLQISVCDDGIGMVRRSDSPGLGLGLALIGKVADRVRLESGGKRERGGTDRGVRMRMTFALDPSPTLN